MRCPELFLTTVLLASTILGCAKPERNPGSEPFGGVVAAQALDTPTPEPAPTDTPKPTATSTPEPTDTPEPPTPTATQIVVISTPRPAPTRTPIPEPAPLLPEIFAQVEAQRAQRVFQLINEARQQGGLNPFRHDERLYQASVKYALNLHSFAWLDLPNVSRDELAGKPIPDPHTRRGTPKSRASEEGYPGGVTEILGFNLILNPRALLAPYTEGTWQQITADMVNGWLASPGHRDAILTPRYVSAGAGCILESNYQRPTFGQPVQTFLCVAVLGTS